MKVLRIKDEIDLRELEKYGFKHITKTINRCYDTEHYIYTEDSFNVYVPVEDIYFGKDLWFDARYIIMDGIEFDLFCIPVIIFELIKADMVEEVEV